MNQATNKKLIRTIYMKRKPHRSHSGTIFCMRIKHEVSLEWGPYEASRLSEWQLRRKNAVNDGT